MQCWRATINERDASEAENQAFSAANLESSKHLLRANGARRNPSRLLEASLRFCPSNVSFAPCAEVRETEAVLSGIFQLAE